MIVFMGGHVKGIFKVAMTAGALAASSPASAAVLVISEFSSPTSASYFPDAGSGATVRGDSRDASNAEAALLFNHYFTLTLRASPGTTLNLTDLSLGVRSVFGYSPSGYFLRGSADNYATDLASLTVPYDLGYFTPQSVNFGTSYLNETEASFRFYYYGVSKDASLSFQNIQFTGLDGVSAAPEPGTWAMMILGFGLIGFALRRRQKVATRVSYAV